jgi:AraC-like DNA-binding protein
VFGPGVVHLVSAGMPLWGFSTSVTFVQDASLVFHPNDVEPMLGETLDPSRLELPLLGLRDDRLFEIVRLLVSATDQFGVAAGLYGDGLVCSAMSLLFAKKTMSDERIHGLAPRQLSQAMELLDERLPERVSISDLATLTNLSPSHFGRAFKKSTGVSPYQWQLRRRIEQAMDQLRDPRFTLDRVATDAGFAEQAHFTRIFRGVTGVPPGQWRRRFHGDVD